jgi:hypothetical protein
MCCGYILVVHLSCLADYLLSHFASDMRCVLVVRNRPGSNERPDYKHLDNKTVSMSHTLEVQDVHRTSWSQGFEHRFMHHQRDVALMCKPMKGQ